MNSRRFQHTRSFQAQDEPRRIHRCMTLRVFPYGAEDLAVGAGKLTPNGYIPGSSESLLVVTEDPCLFSSYRSMLAPRAY